MSYSKLPYGITDYSAGIQSVNQLGDNFLAQWIAFIAEHGRQEPGVRPNGLPAMPPPTLRLGHHNTPKICRAVIQVVPQTLAFSVTTIAPVAAPPVVSSVTRIATGVYFVAMSSLLQEFYAHVDVEQISTDQRLATALTSSGVPGAPVGIVVNVYDHQTAGGGFDLVDASFAVHIYGTTS